MISNILKRFRFSMDKTTTIGLGISLFRHYSDFSMAIRRREGENNKLKSQNINTTQIKFFSQILNINYRIQDVPLIFEIFQNQVYNLDYKPQSTEHIIDLGANIGLSSMYFSHKYGLEIPIISVEPSNQNIKLLDLNISAFKNITKVKAAVSNVNGEFPFCDGGLGYNSKLGSDKESSYMISTMRVNQLISDHNICKIGILKIDIEGTEEILFQGEVSWLELVNNIIIEIHNPNFANTLTKLVGKYGLQFKEKRDSVFLYSKR